MKGIFFDIKPSTKTVLKHSSEKNSYYIIIEPDHKEYCDLLRKYGHSSSIPIEFTCKVFPLRFYGHRNDSQDNFGPIYDEEIRLPFNQLEFHLYSAG